MKNLIVVVSFLVAFGLTEFVARATETPVAAVKTSRTFDSYDLILNDVRSVKIHVRKKTLQTCNSVALLGQVTRIEGGLIGPDVFVANYAEGTSLVLCPANENTPTITLESPDFAMPVRCVENECSLAATVLVPSDMELVVTQVEVPLDQRPHTPTVEELIRAIPLDAPAATRQ